MKRLCSLVLGSIFLLAAQPALATGPSYSCGGRLSVTERAICHDRQLSKLDRTMAHYYHATRNLGSHRERAHLQRAQRLWLQWRDTCGGDRDCLRRRYEQRIIDLAPFGLLPPGFGCQAGFALETGALLPETY